MRIYTNVKDAVREVERDLYEMGLDVHPQTMQDKDVRDDPKFRTKEVQAYGFKIVGYTWNPEDEAVVVNYVLTGNFNAGPHEDFKSVFDYIEQEFQDRVEGRAMNPGRSWEKRPKVWNEFLHEGKFAYTYSERISPQLDHILSELRVRPDTRQAIINIHSNIMPNRYFAAEPVEQVPRQVLASADYFNMGGSGRIPCSLYYQFMRRKGKLDMIYAMRSCDFLTHFYVDLMLALRMQRYVAASLGDTPGTFTYFTGSLHAYYKDMEARGIF